MKFIPLKEDALMRAMNGTQVIRKRGKRASKYNNLKNEIYKPKFN